MKAPHRVLAAAVLIGLGLVIVDAWLDAAFFYGGTFVEMLLTDVPPHEWYVRALILLSFSAFGLMMAMAFARRERAERRNEHLNRVLRAIRNVNQLITQVDARRPLLEDACRALTETRGYTSAGIVLLNRDGGVNLWARSGTDPRAAPAVGVTEREGLPACARRAAAEPGVRVLEGAEAQEACALLGVEPDGLAMTADLTHEGRVYGVLSVAVPPDFAADVEERSLVREVADDLAFALYRLEAEAQYRTLFEEAPVGIFQTRVDGRAVRVNQEMAEMVGAETPEEAVRAFTDLTEQLYVDPSRRDAFIAALRDRGEVEDFEYRARRLDGEIRWFLMNARLVGERDHEPGLIEGFVQDVTDRERAERALRESEERLRQIVQNMPVMMDAMDEDGVIIAWNRECERVTGYSADEIVGNPDAMAWLYPDAEYRERMLARFRAMGNDFREMEAMITCKDGTQRTISWSSISARYPIPGWETWSVGVEVTARLEAEAEREWLLAQVREQARRLTQIMNTVPEGVVLVGPDGEVVTANPVGEVYLDVLAGAGVGETLLHLGNRSLDALLTSPPTQGLWHQIEADHRRFEMIARPVADEDRPEAWVMVIRDVTEERAVQEHLDQQQRLASVGQLAAGIAHDFNNIMAVILLYADLSLQAGDAVPPAVRGRLETIADQAHHASDLIQQILDFSRRSMLERRPMDLQPFLKEQVKLLDRTLPEHIAVSLEIGTDRYRVRGDPTRLQQVMMNLALNARDAMPEGGELRITLGRTAFSRSSEAPLPELPPGMWVRWSVADTGSGIPQAMLSHLFDPFYTTKSPGKGSGLGLPQVHGIIMQHGGAIDVTTEEGAGTRFDIYLPALTTEADAESLIEGETEPVRGQGERILVVEDNPSVRRALEGTLRALGYAVETVANGREALDWLDVHRDEVDLVLSDVVMPEMGGRALLAALKSRRPALPVVLLTGHPMHDEMEALTEDGLNAWLPKPPDPVVLARLLRDILD